MHMLRLYSVEDLDKCPTDKWGILDPGEERRDTGEKRENGEYLHFNLNIR
jgi:5-formyltetrahydrofolate cyclo-ligase